MLIRRDVTSDGAMLPKKIWHLVGIVLPIIPYCRKQRCQQHLLHDEEILNRKEYSQFTKIALGDLQMRLNQEDERASAINEKTYKMGLSLSLALTIIGYAFTELPDQISYSVAKIFISTSIIVGVLYFVLAGLTALGAIRTEPTYGSTTQILLLGKKKKQQCLAKCLAQSEVMNSIRHLRNEAVFQNLRIGHYLFLSAIVLFISSRIFEFIYPLIN